MAQQNFKQKSSHPKGGTKKNLTVDIAAPHYTPAFDPKEVEFQYSQQFGESEMRSQKGDEDGLGKYNLAETPDDSDNSPIQ